MGRDRTRRWGRALALLAGAALLTTFVPAPPVPEPKGPAVTALRMEAVPLDESDAERRTLGPFEFLGGWSLASADPRFGAISALKVHGNRVTALSDSGVLFHFPVPGTGPGRVRIEPLRQGPGDGRRKSDRDSESMLAIGDRRWIGFENIHQIWRYGPKGAESRARPMPMRDWPVNGGAEAMVRLADGRFLVLGESTDDAGTSPALIFNGDPAVPGTPVRTRRYRPPPGFSVTDADLLPDGRVLLLVRRFALPYAFSAKLVLLPHAALAGSGVMEGRVVATLEAPLTVDNMEGLSLTREGGRLILWLASDDNYNAFQRTLLLKFALR